MARRKYQEKGALDPNAHWLVNFDVAKFGRLKDSPGARLAIEYRELSYYDDLMETMSKEDGEKFAKNVNFDERAKSAKAQLQERAKNSDTRFFEEFAEGTEFALKMFSTKIIDGVECWNVGNQAQGYADPLVALCLSKFFGLSIIKGSALTFAELAADLDKSGYSIPEEADLRKLCMKIGMPFSPAKRGRKGFL